MRCRGAGAARGRLLLESDQRRREAIDVDRLRNRRTVEGERQYDRAGVPPGAWDWAGGC